MADAESQKSLLSYVNLSDRYERKARLAPALLTALFILPLSLAYSGPLGGWLQAIVTGVGLGAVAAIGLSHLASAAGNRIQRKIWPRWPKDSPTNCRLHPSGGKSSSQQRAKWYKQIHKLTDLDIEAAVESRHDAELDRVINDAVVEIRYKLRNSPHADRLRIHNADYGFARNFAGLRPAWLSFAVVSALGCWLAVLANDAAQLWGWLSMGVLLLAIPLWFIAVEYVTTRADSYADSFFGALMELSADSRGREHSTKSRAHCK